MATTCGEYRQEMLLLALRRRLARKDLTEREREEIRRQIRRLEQDMNMT